MPGKRSKSAVGLIWFFSASIIFPVTFLNPFYFVPLPSVRSLPPLAQIINHKTIFFFIHITLKPVFILYFTTSGFLQKFCLIWSQTKSNFFINNSFCITHVPFDTNHFRLMLHLSDLLLGNKVGTLLTVRFT